MTDKNRFTIIIQVNCVKWHPQRRTARFCWSKFYCPHAL